MCNSGGFVFPESCASLAMFDSGAVPLPPGELPYPSAVTPQGCLYVFFILHPFFIPSLFTFNWPLNKTAEEVVQENTTQENQAPIGVRTPLSLRGLLVLLLFQLRAKPGKAIWTASKSTCEVHKVFYIILCHSFSKNKSSLDFNLFCQLKIIRI